MSGSTGTIGRKEGMVVQMSTDEISNVLTKVTSLGCRARIDTEQVVLFGDIKPGEKKNSFSFNSGNGDDQIVLGNEGWSYEAFRQSAPVPVWRLKLRT